MGDLLSQPPAFARLDRTVQAALYSMKWTRLRPIQVESIHEVLDGVGDLVISARTASGKTEAAFLPILSRIIGDPQPSFRAIYVGPLKALINDQFLRLERLCEIAEIPVHKWHGDVGQAAKRRAMANPSGVLLITPESIESLFVNQSRRLASAFAHLEFIVIDEMHSFFGSERGAHLRSLASRLASISRDPVRCIGLSATLGDMNAACTWLRPREPSAVRLIQDSEDTKRVALRLYGYLLRPNHSAEAAEERWPLISDKLAEDVFQAFHGRTALIFANSKSTIEAHADFARREAARRGVRDTFAVHHGSLSKGEREQTEEDLRSNRPTATFCSSTLEMGIDVGSVQAIGQIGAPWSVASMIQRLGRSGRREGDTQEMRLYIQVPEPDPTTSLVNRLFPKLLQTIAMVELMAVEKWCEPPNVNRLHLSTLVQQILSVITEGGGVQADRLHTRLIARGAFSHVDTPTFLNVLRDMGAADLIEQTSEGLLILGMVGERIVRHHDFYLAFQVPREYRVSHGARHIGNVAYAPDLDREPYLILAGRRWKALDVDEDRLTISVVPSPGGRKPEFEGGDCGEIHPRIRSMMRSILLRNDLPIYLDPGARELLSQARATAREAGLSHTEYVQDGPDLTWFTWTGTRINSTLAALATHFGKFRVEDCGIALRFEKANRETLTACYQTASQLFVTSELLAPYVQGSRLEKYEPYLSETLRTRIIAYERLDLNGAMRMIEPARTLPPPASI